MQRAKVDHELEAAVGQHGFAKGSERAFHGPILLDYSGELRGVRAPKEPLAERSLECDFVNGAWHARNISRDGPTVERAV